MAAPLAAAPQSVVWTSKLAYGTTDHALDGDTVAVRADGDGSAVAPLHVRNAGIQAMETGQCHAAAATASMDELTRGKRLRLTTADVTTSSQGRPVRYIDAQSGSTWTDVQLTQLQRGQALPLAGMGDISRWKAYATAGQQAAVRRANLFDTDYCKSGPAQSTPLRLWINYDGNGNEAYNANTEYVRVLNGASTALAVGGWWIRTAAQDTYTLPSNAVVPAKGVLTLRVGKGTNTPTRLYWGAAGPKFSNVDLSRNIYGGGAYLFDRDGDLRSWSIYPCLASCGDARTGHVAIWVNADAPGVAVHQRQRRVRPFRAVRAVQRRPVVDRGVDQRLRLRVPSRHRRPCRRDPHPAFRQGHQHPAEPLLGQCGSRPGRRGQQRVELRTPTSIPPRLPRVGHRTLLTAALGRATRGPA